MGHEETRYGAEYYGEEYPPVEEAQRDEPRLAWLEDRSWCMDVFTKADVYGDDLIAGARLRSGLRRARAQLRLGATTYVDLASPC